MTATRSACREPWLRVTLLAAFLAGLVAGPAAAAVEVKLRLPVRARIDLTGKRTITPAPFIVVTREGAGEACGNVGMNLGEFGLKG